MAIRGELLHDKHGFIIDRKGDGAPRGTVPTVACKRCGKQIVWTIGKRWLPIARPPGDKGLCGRDGKSAHVPDFSDMAQLVL